MEISKPSIFNSMISKYLSNGSWWWLFIDHTRSNEVTAWVSHFLLTRTQVSMFFGFFALIENAILYQTQRIDDLLDTKSHFR